MRTQISLLVAAALLLALTACAEAAPSQGAAGDALAVVATTNIVADVVRQVGGEHVQVTSLVQPGQDPHNFNPSPQDIAGVAAADLVFANGAGLEEGFIDRLIENAGQAGQVIGVSDGLALAGDEAEAAHGEAGEAHAHPDGDPHTWTDPRNVLAWVERIEAALQEADPAHTEDYAQNAAAYRQQLNELDAWIAEQVAAIPPERRKLISDHQLFTYFAERYGFELAGALSPGFSTAAQPSAQDLAALEDALRAGEVRVILVGQGANPNLAERVAADTGAQVVTLYTGSLSAADGPAANYLDYMRYNVNAIVEALRG